MAAESSKHTLYFLTIKVVPQVGGQNVRDILNKISDKLTKGSSSTTKVVLNFKVTGETKIVVVIQVSKTSDLENILDGIYQVGAVEVESQPILAYERFAENMKLPGELCKLGTSCCLDRSEGIYWLTFSIEYHGHEYDKFVAIWKNEAEAVLSLRSKGAVKLELFKIVAERKVIAFFNSPDVKDLDLLSLELPIMKENGNNMDIKCKAVQFFSDYADRK